MRVWLTISTMKNESWYCISLTRDQVASGVEINIQFIVVERFLKLGAPKGVALLDNSSPKPFTEPPLDCYLYLTPSAVPYFQDLIDHYQGHPCPEPPTYSTLLAGDDAFLSETRNRASESQEESS
jgi:hypothetical protein